jgi:phosphatidylserine/phosphatidylglycerophosphate/cardiolipin synthase-like enzyme
MTTAPGGGRTEAVAGALKQARKTVLIQAYTFTSSPIAKALVEAHGRGVQVQVILGKSQRSEKFWSTKYLSDEGIPVAIDGKHGVAHNKVMVIDGERVITGSFNFTAAAEEHNAENLLVIDDADVAAKYTANWKNHERHAVAYP